VTETTPRVVQGTIENSSTSLFQAARPLVEEVDKRFADLLKENGVDNPSAPEATEFFQTHDMDGFYQEVAESHPELTGVLVETVALLIGSITVCRVNG
jgi:hypothetical protein